MPTSDSSAHNTLKQKIDALKVEIASNSISPERMGTLLDELVALSDTDNKAMISQTVDNSTNAVPSSKAVNDKIKNDIDGRITQSVGNETDKVPSNKAVSDKVKSDIDGRITQLVGNETDKVPSNKAVSEKVKSDIDGRITQSVGNETDKVPSNKAVSDKVKSDIDERITQELTDDTNKVPSNAAIKGTITSEITEDEDKVPSGKAVKDKLLEIANGIFIDKNKAYQFVADGLNYPYQGSKYKYSDISDSVWLFLDNTEELVVTNATVNDFIFFNGNEPKQEYIVSRKYFGSNYVGNEVSVPKGAQLCLITLNNSIDYSNIHINRYRRDVIQEIDFNDSKHPVSSKGIVNECLLLELSMLSKGYVDKGYALNTDPNTGSITGYIKSESLDTIIFKPLPGSKTIRFNGFTPYGMRVFNDYEPSEKNLISKGNVSGISEIPEGTKVIYISCLKSVNTGGYDKAEIIQEKGIPSETELKLLSENAYIKRNFRIIEEENGIINIGENINNQSVIIHIQDGCMALKYDFGSKSPVAVDNVYFFAKDELTQQWYIGKETITLKVNYGICRVPKGTKIAVLNLYYTGTYRDDRIKDANIAQITKSNNFFDIGFLTQRTTTDVYSYVRNDDYSCLWIPISDNISKIVIEGFQGTSTLSYRFFKDTIPSTEGYLGVNTSGEVIEGATLCIANFNNTLNEDGYKDLNVKRYINASSRKKISILKIGNSLSQDTFSYVPFILQNMNKDVEIEIGMAVYWGQGLSKHIEAYNSQERVYSYNLFDSQNSNSWQTTNSRTIKEILNDRKWDIIILNDNLTPTLNGDVNNVIKYINLIFKDLSNNVKVGWQLIQSIPSDGSVNYGDSVISDNFIKIVDNAKNILDKTVIDFIVPVGTAFENARTIPTIKALGDYANDVSNTSKLGYLTSDGTHAQEGLPCQIQAYVATLSILRLYGFDNIGIYGEDTRVNSTWMNNKNIPGTNGEPIEVTDDTAKIAQIAAIMAFKKPYEVTDLTILNISV